jgi:putative ABC transport system permease protein
MRYNQTVVARLRPGVSIEQARGEMDAVMAALAERYPPVLQGFLSGLSIPLVPLGEETFGRSRTLLLVLMGAVAIVLLIVCADVANLMLTRFGSRRREVAVRWSLGASRMRIVRQLLTESLTIGMLGCALGLLFANLAMRRLLSFAAETLPRVESISFHPRVLAFAMALAILAPLLFGALPALRSVSGGAAGALKESLRTASAGRKDSRLLAALAVTQVALALVLSVGAGLLVRSFLHLLGTDPGFRPERTVRVTATLPSGGYTTRRQVISFFERAIEAARAVPGVRAAGAGNFLPLAVRERRAFTPEGGAQAASGKYRSVSPTWASPGYLEALGVPLKSGRFLREADGPEQPVVVVNEVLAKTAWPGEDPVGRRLKWGIEASQSPWMTVVGVVGDVKQSALEEPAIAQVYAPLALLEFPSPIARTVNVVARSDRDPEALIADLREVVRRLDPALPLKAQPLGEMIRESLRPRRFSMTIVALFAVVALALAGIGIYGVLASIVTQQKHEIAIRIALGATGGTVIWMVLRRTLILMAAGVGFGTAGALGLTKVMASLLYEVRPTDGVAFFAAAVLLTLLALLASLAPAWRATRVSPLAALKSE